MDLFVLILWLVAGTFVLSIGDITRIQYAICWGTLIVNLLANLL